MEGGGSQFTSHCKSRAGVGKARYIRSCRKIFGDWGVFIAKFRVARDSPKVSGSATELPFPQWGGWFGRFSERVLLGPRNPSSSQNARTRCRRAFVRQTSTA